MTVGQFYEPLLHNIATSTVVGSGLFQRGPVLAPVLADKIIEAPSCNRYGLERSCRPLIFQNQRVIKITFPKVKVEFEKNYLQGKVISGSLQSGKFMCDPKICPLTYLDVFFTSSIGDVRGGARKFTRRPPVPQNRRKIFPLDSITLMLM
ncbi:hypothetical protein TNCT_402731 [Trichonephila clavata]|uniref:Uncharacterized protein n=1 Tax=Trichonephila clavata TaxID=2740835 RepID=A0A8X6LJR3_TRICU|nr:hypothetical protein TNCT_402731 [Trichonephila clavata]